MTRLRRCIAILPCFLGLLMLVGLSAGCQRQGTQVRLGGGPTGGTFQVVAEGLAASVFGEIPEVRVTVERSGGSLANLLDVEAGTLDFGLVYAGDAFLGNRGLLDKTESATSNVRAVARLYGATAQLVVLQNRPFQSPHELVGNRIAIGSPGSGAAISAERFFRALGIWEKIHPVYLGYSMAMQDLVRGGVGAVWELVGVPSASLTEISRKRAIRLLDLEDAARTGGLYEKYPFYSPTVIPAGTYAGQYQEVHSFQDSALLVAHAEVDQELVFRVLTRLFGEQGLAAMKTIHPIAADLSPDLGMVGIQIPFHPGAKRFWTGRGVLVPSDQ